MNISKIGIYSAIAKTQAARTSFKGNNTDDNRTKANAMLNDSFLRPVTDYEITHLDLPEYTKCEKGKFIDRFIGNAEFDTMVKNSSFERLEKSNDAADKVIRYTLQQIKDGNASASSTFNYKGLDSTKELCAAFKNGISVSLKYNLAAADTPNVITVTARSGNTQEILLYNNGLERSKRVEKLKDVLALI